MNNEETKTPTPGEIWYDRFHDLWPTTPATWYYLPDEVKEIYEKCASAAISHVLQGAKYVLLEPDQFHKHKDECLVADDEWEPVQDHWFGKLVGGGNPCRRPISLPSSVRPEGKPLGGLAEFFGGEFPRPSTAPPVSSGAAGADVPEAEPLMVLKHEPDVPANLFSGPQGPAVPSAEPVVEESSHGEFVMACALNDKDKEVQSLTSERDQLRKELESSLGDLRIMKSHWDAAEDEIKRLTTENAALKETYKASEALWQRELQGMRDGSTIQQREADWVHAEQENAELEQELARLRSQFRWTPISERLPTEKDANSEKCVLVKCDNRTSKNEIYPVCWIHYKNLTSGCGYTHWLPASFIPTLPSSPETEEQAMRREFVLLWKSWIESTGKDLNQDGCFHFFKAAKQSTGGQA